MMIIGKTDVSGRECFLFDLVLTKSCFCWRLDITRWSWCAAVVASCRDVWTLVPGRWRMRRWVVLGVEIICICLVEFCLLFLSLAAVECSSERTRARTSARIMAVFKQWRSILLTFQHSSSYTHYARTRWLSSAMIGKTLWISNEGHPTALACMLSFFSWHGGCALS